MEVQAANQAISASIEAQSQKIRVIALDIKKMAVAKMEADIRAMQDKVNQAKTVHGQATEEQKMLSEKQKENAEKLVRLEEAREKVVRGSQISSHDDNLGQAKTYSNAA